VVTGGGAGAAGGGVTRVPSPGEATSSAPQAANGSKLLIKSEARKPSMKVPPVEEVRIEAWQLLLLKGELEIFCESYITDLIFTVRQ
jgi:hypothetical protein